MTIPALTTIAPIMSILEASTIITPRQVVAFTTHSFILRTLLFEVRRRTKPLGMYAVVCPLCVLILYQVSQIIGGVSCVPFNLSA